MKNVLYKKITRALLAAAFILLMFSPVVRGTNFTALHYPYFQKGMGYAAWSKDAMLNSASDTSLKIMAEAKIKCVSIVVTWYQDTYNSTGIARTDRTPSDTSIRHAIRTARQYGMYVMLKPHVDLASEEGNTRSDIGFNSDEKWKAWFSNYLEFMIHYAGIAEEEGAEFFCVGTELTFASTKSDFWKNNLIPKIRKTFHGQLTYAANWDEYDKVEFWDELDYIGIDAYFPLSAKDNPSLEEIRAGWKPWLAEIEAFQRKTDKPVIFTEIGYCSANTAARKPWEESVSGESNPDLQANCYRALFEAFWDKPWFFGVYWWSWTPNPNSGGLSNRRFTPQNKPALAYVTSWYSQMAGPKLAFNSKTFNTISNPELAERFDIQKQKLAARGAGAANNVAFVGAMSGEKERVSSVIPSE